MNVFYHTGDMGDIIASLPTVEKLGGGIFVIGPRRSDAPGGLTREDMKGERFQAIKFLLESQPYIHRVEWTDEGL